MDRACLGNISPACVCWRTVTVSRLVTKPTVQVEYHTAAAPVHEPWAYEEVGNFVTDRNLVQPY